MSVDADTFIPEFWPANRILGLILDDQLEGLSAGKIVGQIVSDQVASLAAAKIEGKLTQEQIETIAAEQITGKLTDEQIAEIAAAKIVGQLSDAQLGGISAAKIIGEIASGQISSLEALKITGKLTNAQIEALEAAKITGQLTNAQIKSIEAAKLTGQLTNTQIAGLAAAKVEGLLTSAQIESLAVAKLVGQISESQIAAKAVTAGKINVAELSAISAKAGTIEAGIFRGVTFETTDGNTYLTNSGLGLTAPKIGGAGNTNRIQWFKEKLKEQVSEIITYLSESGGTAFLRLEVNAPSESGVSQLALWASHLKGEVRFILEGAKTLRKLYFEIGEITKTLFTSEQKSDFMQLSSTRRERDFGLVGTTLPKEPVVGDRCIFEPVEGVKWWLIYDGVGETPWKFIGGQPIYAEANAENTTASEAYVELANNPAIKLPAVKGEWDITWGCRCSQSNNNAAALMAISIAGAAPVEGYWTDFNTGTSGANIFINTSRSKRASGVAASAEVKAKYRQSGGGTAKFSHRWLEITPVRIG